MKKLRFTDRQIMDALKQAEAGIKFPGLCRELGISVALLYRWRARFGGMDVSMLARMKELEGENQRLRQLGGAASALRPAWQAELKCIRRALQQECAARGAQCLAVRLIGAGTVDPVRMAHRVQHGALL